MQNLNVFLSHCIKKKNEVINLHMHYPIYGLPVIFPVSIVKIHFYYTFEDTSWKMLGNFHFRPLNLYDYHLINKKKTKLE